MRLDAGGFSISSVNRFHAEFKNTTLTDKALVVGPRTSDLAMGVSYVWVCRVDLATLACPRRHIYQSYFS